MVVRTNESHVLETARRAIRPPAGDQSRPSAPTPSLSAAPPDAVPGASPAPALGFERFGVYYHRFRALKDVTVRMPAGQITAIMGPSGCGKSTLLRSINRMNDRIPRVRFEGQILIGQEPLYAPGTNLIRLRKRIGMVFQKPNPFAASIFDNVAWGPRVHRMHRGRAMREHVEGCLTRAGLWDEVKDKLSMNAMSLSGGQQQRLCIARALAVEPEVLLMDEPCSALDPITTYHIEQLMRELLPDYTIVIVTHNMQQAGRVSDASAFFWMDDDRAGYLVEYGTTERIFQRPENELTERYISGRMG
jgi:phosphate transport system ATP-binding protein